MDADFGRRNDWRNGKRNRQSERSVYGIRIGTWKARKWTFFVIKVNWETADENGEGGPVSAPEGLIAHPAKELLRL
jgi:hypothetical protein